MKKIRKTLQGIARIIQNPWLLNNVLNDNDLWKKKVKSAYNMQAGLPTIGLDDLFPDFTEKLSSFSFLGGGSLPTDIALLKGVNRKFKNSNYFEIGTWRGESVCNVAEVAEKCYTLNLSKSQMLALGLPEKYADAHAFFSKNLPNVIHLEGDSKIFDFKGFNKKFDVVFIDGNHHYDYIVSDTQNVFSHLIHENSIVIWHDYGYDPESIRFEVMKAILDGVPKHFHANLYHVSNTKSAIFIRDNFNAGTLDPNANPEKTFEIELRIKKIKFSS